MKNEAQVERLKEEYLEDSLDKVYITKWIFTTGEIAFYAGIQMQDKEINEKEFKTLEEAEAEYEKLIEEHEKWLKEDIEKGEN